MNIHATHASLFLGGVILLSPVFALPEAKFRAQTIDDKIDTGYGLAVSDVDGDGLADVILADAAEIVWFQNPTWKKFQLTGKLTKKDHVCLCAADIDDDGLADVAVGAGWNPGDTLKSGAVFVLKAGEDRLQPWSQKALPHEPTVHRMHWARDAEKKVFLAVLPLHGKGNKNGEGEGVKLMGYRPGKDLAADWQTFLIHQGFHSAHNFDPVKWHGTKGDSFLVACREGVQLLQPGEKSWSAQALTEAGAGEVRMGKLPDGRSFIATIEPMHGNAVVINPENKDGMWSDKRVVVDETLNQGHALVTGDFLGLGYDQVVAGWREPTGDEMKVGLRLYVPTGKDGSAWKLHAVIDDNNMACEDLKTVDLNGDGRLDLIASGRATKNVIIYWNEKPKR